MVQAGNFKMARKTDGEADSHFSLFCMVSTAQILPKYHKIIYKSCVYLFGRILCNFMALLAFLRHYTSVVNFTFHVVVVASIANSFIT